MKTQSFSFRLLVAREAGLDGVVPDVRLVTGR